MSLPFHPYAGAFPLIEGEEFEALRRDIAENGLRRAIRLLDGKVLDGRNRYRALLANQMVRPDQTKSVYFERFDPKRDGDPLAFVISENFHRRHLDVNQRAIVAARLANMPQGARTDLRAREAAKPSAKLPKVGEQISQAQAAKMLSVSPRSLGAAKAVLAAGTAELVKAVERGHLAVSLAEKAAHLSPALQKEIAAEAQAGRADAVRRVVKRAARAEREAALAKKQCALPDKKYGVILADPEWDFEAFDRDTGGDRSPGNHYPTSSEEEIAARAVAKIADKNCLLLLWTTDLARGIRVMEAWGFVYKSYFVWVKDIVEFTPTPEQKKTGLGGKGRLFIQIGPHGTGFWNLDRDEILLIGTRGNVPAPAPGTQGESVIFAARPKENGKKRGKHSAKPDNIHEWVERHYPNLPKIELNARRARPGWDAWGNEAPEQGEAA